MWGVFCRTTGYKVGHVSVQPQRAPSGTRGPSTCSGHHAKRRRGCNPPTLSARTNRGRNRSNGSTRDLRVVVGRNGRANEMNVLCLSSGKHLLVQTKQQKPKQLRKLEVCRCTPGGFQRVPGPGEGEGFGGKKGQVSRPSLPSPSLESVLAHLQRNFMPYGLVAAICVSILMPSLGCKVHQLKLHKLSAPGIFLISGLMLKFGDVKRAVKSPLPLFLGLISISFVLPASSCFFALQWPYLSRDLVLGMAVFLCMPTALSTGVQICTHFGGNPALALMLTVATNLLSIVTIPALVTCFLTGGGGTGTGAGTGALVQHSGQVLTLDSFLLFRSLVKSILVPMLFGIALRAKSGRVSKWVEENRKTLSMLSACLLISVPLAELSLAVGKGVVLTYRELLQVAGLGVLFPLCFILFNRATTTLFCGKRVPEEIKRTVVVVGSLKTLPSAVMVIQKLQEILPSLSGVALVPPMMFHIIQTILISAYASNTNGKEKESE